MSKLSHPVSKFNWRARAYLVGINANEMERKQLCDARTVAKKVS
jgi:hypothetical protein